MDVMKRLNMASVEAYNFLKMENKYLKKLLEAGELINSMELKEYLKFILDAILEIIEAQRGIILLCNRDYPGEYEYIVSTDDNLLKGEDFPICTTIARKVAQTGKPELVENVINDPEYNLQESVNRLRLRSLLCLPLFSGGEVSGILYMDSGREEHNFSTGNLKLLEAFASRAAQAIEQAKLFNKIKTDNIHLKKELAGSYQFGDIIWASKEMKEIITTLRNVLDNTVTVLIYGETGTGKELIARAIHYNGIRKDQKYLTQNCGALTLSLLESELFGFKKGAFTGAYEDRAGLFEAADRGTIFLDEIGETSQEVQVRLLRVLENGTIRRIGELQDRKINIRILAATNKDLKQLVAEGKFREDLYYRLNVFPIHLPPLRKRRDDIPVLINHFINLFNKTLNKEVSSLSEELLEQMMQYSWPGNIRELKNCIYRLMILSGKDQLEAAGDFDFSSRENDDAAGKYAVPGNLKTLAELEKDYILYVLKCVKNNKSVAARKLGLKRTTFLAKMRKIEAGFE